jgi:acyl-CoA synthetase (NDP forming)/RimJ/RimL family protein N-acetyltransferase
VTEAEVDVAALTWPAHWEADVTTADGGTVHVRPITPDDADRLVAFHGRQSPESIYFRFFSARPTLSAAEVARFTHVDLHDRVAFIALLDDDLIGVARYDRYRESGDAEVAFFIDDHHHGRGLATILLEYLAAAGRDNGVSAFVASVLPANRAMLSVFTSAGFDAVTRYADGVVEVRFEIAPTAESMAAVEDRAVRADARTVARLMEPRSVAVIGAGRTQRTLGHEVLRQLIAHDFAGPVYAVNREATHVASVPAWASVLDLPEPVDLAVVAVPAEEVLDAVEECARARVGALVVVSTGFAEAGPEGLERARALVALAHRHGIRVLGPGSLGLINTAPGVRLHASFTLASPAPGPVALSLQSGTLGAGIIRRAGARGLGFSSVAAVGDKLDVSGNDLLAWWEADDRTEVIVLSLASYGNPRRFRRLAPRVGRHKPIVAMVREPSGGVIDLLGQMGVIGVESMAEMIDTTCLLAGQPLPAGPRVAVVADARGSADFAEAACRTAGLDVVATTAVGADADPSAFGAAVGAALAEGAGADAVLVVYASGVAARPVDVAREVAAAASVAGSTKTVVAAFPGHDIGGGLPVAGGRRIPDLEFPDAAARSLAAAVRHSAWLARAPGVLAPASGADPEAADGIVATWLDEHGPGTLDIATAGALLEAAGATVVAQQVVASVSEAAEAAAAIGGPVALKAIGRPATAKTEGAGVSLDLQAPDDVAASWGRMEEALGGAMTGGVVQAMVAPGTDLRIVLEPAPIVGAAIGVGLGGVIAGLAAPAARGVLPLSDVAAADLVDRAGLGSLLDDAGTAAVGDLLLRVSWLAEEVADIERLELNPVIVSGDRAWVIDSTVEVAPGHDHPPDDLRRLAT